MSRAVIAILVLSACSDPTGGKAAITVPPATHRIALAMDSLNAGIRTLYLDGGVVELLQLIYPDPIGDVPIPPPVAAIITRTR
jgi:hypothetical protein